MSGGLIQLAAFGTQDILLTANPQITFFKVTVRRHTAFAIESIMQTITGSGTNFGSDLTVTISRSGDLLWHTTIEVVIPQMVDTAVPPSGVCCRWSPARWTDDIGHHLIQSCEVQIGGQRIDKHYSDWLQIWSQLTIPAEKRDGYNRMIGNVMELCGTPDAPIVNNIDAGAISNSSLVYKRPAYRLYIPLQFWFCRNPGMALPLIALPYHEVKLMIKLNEAKNLVIPGCFNADSNEFYFSINAGDVTPNTNSGSNTLAQSLAIGSSSDVNALITTAVITNPADNMNAPLAMQVWADYIYLDVNERKRFAQTSHEYLIDQLQYTGGQNIAPSVSEAQLNLNFNHPTKELVWVLRKDSYTKNTNANVLVNYQNVCNQWSNYQITAYNAAANRYSNMDGRIFGQMEYGNMSTTDFNPVEIARLQLNGNDRFRDRHGEYFNLVQPYQHHTCIPQSKGINVYSFGLQPEDIQPTGTINFSRIDNTQLLIRTKSTLPAIGLGGVVSSDNTSMSVNNNTVNAYARYVFRTGGSRTTVGIAGGVTACPVQYVVPSSDPNTADAPSVDNVGYNVLIYATNFNVLRIISGMGGLAFSN